MKLAGIMLVLMLAMAGAFKWYYDSSQARISTLVENQAKLETAVKISEDSIKLMREDAEKQAKLNQQLQSDLQKAEQYGDQLRNTLQKHNLTHLAETKPGLIEKRMQDATNKLWVDLRGITEPAGVQSPANAGAGTQSNNSN